jgi:hypothetical protein
VVWEEGEAELALLTTRAGCAMVETVVYNGLVNLGARPVARGVARGAARRTGALRRILVLGAPPMSPAEGEGERGEAGGSSS